ncbi:MAG: hypothetical protein WD490_07825 [Opitutales bacterium]
MSRLFIRVAVYSTLFCTCLHGQELSLDGSDDAFGSELSLTPLVEPENVNPTHPQTGLTPKIKAFHHPDTLYDLYLPSAYDENSTRRFPLLLVQNPGGSPKIESYLDWAEERAVIVVGLHKVANGMAQHLKPGHWNAFIKDLEAKDVRFQKGLFLTVGMSGGSADGERFTRHFPEHVCGVIVMGVLNAPADDRRQHIASGLIIGGKDSFQSPEGLERMWERIRNKNIAVRAVYDIGRQHETAPLSETLMLLDWLLDLGELRSPQLPEEAKQAHLENLREEMGRMGSLPSGGERKDRIAHLLTLPPLLELPEAESLRALWVEDVLTLAASIPDPAERGVYLLDISTDSEVFPQLKDAEKVSYAEAVARLRQRDGLADLPAQWRELEDIKEQEWKAHLDKDALRQVDQSYADVLKRMSIPSLQERARQARERLKGFLQEG